MSWLFGMKPSTPPAPPSDDRDIPSMASGGGGGGDGKGGSPPNKPPTKEDSTRMAYAFDSAALERAARAAKDLEKSSKIDLY